MFAKHISLHVFCWRGGEANSKIASCYRIQKSRLVSALRVTQALVTIYRRRGGVKDFWGNAWFSGEQMEGSVFGNGVSNMDKRKLTANELSMRGGAAGGVGQRGEEIIRTLQSLVGRSANFIVAQQKSCDPNPKLTPPLPPGDIMICPLARKPRSSNDTTAYMFIY